MHNEWISIDERPPDTNGQYLVCGARGGMSVATAFLPRTLERYTGDPNACWWTKTGTNKPLNPRWWMPLPKSPIGDN